MDKDLLIEPGGSSIRTAQLQELQNDDTLSEKCSPSAALLTTPTKSEVAESPFADAKPVAVAWTSPLERAAIEMSRRRAMTRMKPNLPYVVLSCLQIVLGVAIVAIGGAAFSTTPSYRAGCFWAGLIVLLSSAYNLFLLCLKLILHKNKWFRKYKHPMYCVIIVLCIVCILATITAAIMDILAAYMIHRTDFSLCLHTGDSQLVVDCDSRVCSDMHLPPNTCYCCHLYRNRKAKGCDIPFLLDKQAYFKGVDSCDILSDRLYPLLMTVALLCLVSTALNLVFLFKSRPVRYYVKSEKGGEEKEVDEEEIGEEDGENEGERGGRLSKFIHNLKVKRDNNGGKRADIRYMATKTEETVID